MTEAAAPPWRRHALPFALGGAMLLLLGLSFHGLGRHSLWLDEAYAVAVARQDLSAIAPSLADESGPPLYYWILHVWIALFGDGERAVRLLSILFGVLLVPATALLARRIGGRRAGLAAAYLVAATPIVVQFSQEARMYTLLPLLTVLAAERLLAYMQEGRRGALAAHALLLVAILYVHNWGILLLPGVALAAVALGPWARVRGFALAALAALLLYAPWARVLLSQAGAPSYRFIGMVQTLSPWELPFRSLVVFASGAGTTGAEARSLLPSPGGALAACAWAALLAAPLLDPRRRRVTLALLLMSTAPLAAAAAYSALARPIYLLGRYEILVLPLLVAIVAGALAGLLRGLRLAGVVALWVLALSALSFSYTARVQRRFPERDLARRLAPELRDGDRVVFTGLYRAAMEYYLRRAGARFEAASFPPDVADHIGWFYDGLYAPDDPVLAAAARADCPGEGRRTWIVASGTRTCRLLLEQLGLCARLASPFETLGPPSSYLLLAVPKEAGG